MKKRAAGNKTPDTAYNVFISSSHKDRALARDLARRLKDAGVHTSYSELTLSAGSDYEKTFMKLLKYADEIIVILSSNSVNNLWMMFEIGAASCRSAAGT